MGDSLLVMKFGGTSVGSSERIRGVADLAAQMAGSRPTVVVVSAMGDTTDVLLALAAAITDDPDPILDMTRGMAALYIVKVVSAKHPRQ